MDAALNKLRQLAVANGLEVVELPQLPALILSPGRVSRAALRQALANSAPEDAKPTAAAATECEVSVAERQELFALFHAPGQPSPAPPSACEAAQNGAPSPQPPGPGQPAAHLQEEP
ncbi:MAG TPA: hypothetical protein ENJ73_03665 [Desulfobacterales bacterium]|nr:hypothetical protein [Desulfobacterales bacterium]